jgi:hypothetical protein
MAAGDFEDLKRQIAEAKGRRSEIVAVEGLKELRAALKQTEHGVKDMKAANKETAGVVAAEAAKRAPKRTGKLRMSIRAVGLADAGAVRSSAVAYANPIHWGWHTRPNAAKGWRGGPIAPQPFIYDALDATRGDVLKTYEALIDRAMRENLGD